LKKERKKGKREKEAEMVIKVEQTIIKIEKEELYIMM
jgi:hypothetical protein